MSLKKTGPKELGTEIADNRVYAVGLSKTRVAKFLQLAPEMDREPTLISPWCNGYGVRLATGRSRVRSPPWKRSLVLPQRHQLCGVVGARLVLMVKPAANLCTIVIGRSAATPASLLAFCGRRRLHRACTHDRLFPSVASPPQAIDQGVSMALALVPSRPCPESSAREVKRGCSVSVLYTGHLKEPGAPLESGSPLRGTRKEFLKIVARDENLALFLLDHKGCVRVR
ncbi:hypothetical protein DPMN_122170 [Dreissena polymorpha]|uniref:Uncharacterized protein n=1 Tax=Dreissena polymorpha TaxID=45954 RepID=A0A9D4GRX3_DREPO|nr:hypothetical protein DPMN_122170 [Dreissena polymorpha]